MQSSYTRNYLRIYLTQFLAILVNVLSLVIVIPYLSNDSKVYGIYTLCISFIIFFSYSDLGFLNAGYKYASEYYAKGNKKKEIEIIGFVSFILLVFTLLFGGSICILSFHPGWLIKDISDQNDILIAKKLLFTLALFSPNFMLQRILQLIYGIRVQDYILQQILLIINVFKIASVYFFYSTAEFNITGYFLFCQILTSAGLLFGFFYASNKYSIPVKYFLSCIKFSKETFYSIKSLALGSLYVTIAWLLFYEFDPYAIAKLSGAEAVAYYSIGLTCLGFFRSVYGALFGPFNARFNHFVATQNFDGLRDFAKTIMCVLLPVVVFPTITISLLSKPFVYTWVGDQFQQSVKIVTLLSLCNVFAFITYPAGILSMATKKIRFLYFISSLQIIIYWGGIAIFFSKYGYIVFAYFELTCFLVTGILYTWLIYRFLQVSILKFIKLIILPAIIPVLLLVIILFSIHNFMPLSKGKINLLIVAITGITAVFIATFAYYFTSEVFRNYINPQLLKISKRLKTQPAKF